MAFDPHLLDRIRHYLKDLTPFREAKMMGGLCIMVNDKMCLGIDKEQDGSNRLMLRLDPLTYHPLLEEEGIRAMDMTGRPMKGFIFVADFAFEDDAQLHRFIDLALEYNPRAKASKKKTKKVE